MPVFAKTLPSALGKATTLDPPLGPHEIEEPEDQSETAAPRGLPADPKCKTIQLIFHLKKGILDNMLKDVKRVSPWLPALN